ncbi:mucin-2-like [Neocloeon triangulifer]|uniref:mucin-2-like n=1 Tax=Neocloeon triangulifer TaxID=2078957 RepID=UPI00286F74C5|nr:mucin-2-like [Neocloeon triangulifer]
MWNTRLAVVYGLLAFALIAKGQQNANYNYQPPQQSRGSSQYLPPDNQYLPSDPALEASQGPSNQYLSPEEDRNLLSDANEGSQQIIGLEQPHQDKGGEHHGGDHHDHHEHWDLRESIPGEPGEDYPLHHTPPETGFSCQGRIVGYYADIQAGCQAFHVCTGDDSSPQSFLCPNGTIFNQEVFACEWWNNVDCAASETHYAKNSEIGVVIPYKGERIPVVRTQSNPQINSENDINFQPASSNEDESRLYLPPTDAPPPTTTRRPVTQPPSTYLPPQRVTRPPPPPPAPSTPRPTFRPIVVAEIPTNQIQQQSNFNNNFQGYDYPKPTTTQRPIAAGPSNNLPSFSETDGYSYPKPEVGLPDPTRRPVTTTTRRPVPTTTTTRRPIVTTTTTRRPIVTTTTTRRPIDAGQSNQLPSFSEADGYSYPKPSVGLPIPTTTRRPVTTTRRPIVTTTTTRRPIIVTTTTTRRPVIQTTQRPISAGPSNELPSFSEADGYNYPKPSVGLPIPTTTRRPVTTTRRPITTTRRPVTTTQRPIASGPSNQLPSFSQTDGYSYPKPSVGLPIPTTTRQPITTRAPTTTRQPVYTTTLRPNDFGSSNQNPSVEGYNYPKPSVAFPLPTTTRQPITTTTRRPVTTTFRPVTTTYRPVTTQRPAASDVNEESGYNYPKPSVAFPLPTTTRTPITTTRRPVTTTFRPVTTTFQPVTTQRPAASGVNEESGYTYPKPSVPFFLPSTTQEPVFIQTTQGAQFGAGSDDSSFVTSSAASTSGYNYPKPNIPFELPQRPQPSPAPSDNEGYSYPTPGSPFSVYQRNQQSLASNANLINQAYQSAPPCIHTQQSAALTSASAHESESLTITQQFLPPVGIKSDDSGVIVQAPTIGDLDGYDFPKPSIGFVTGKKKPLKNEVLAPFNPEEATQDIGGQQIQQNSGQFQQAFIDGFNLAQQGNSATYSRQQSALSSYSHSGSFVESQKSQQIANHVLEIIPSISYSYQLENKQEDPLQGFQRAAAPSAFKRSKNHAIY